MKTKTIPKEMSSYQIPSSLLLLLTFLIALPIISTDIYLPSLNSIGTFFSASTQEVQLTLTSYFILFGVVQLFYGSLADHFGRRPVLLISLFLYILGTTVCMLSNTIQMLILGRCLQSLGAGSSILVFAMIRDMYEGVQATRILSYMSAVVAISPIIAPIFGGYIQKHLSWQWNFSFLLLLSAFLLIISYWLLPETTKNKKTTRYTLSTLILEYRKLLKEKLYFINALSAASAFGALFAYISGSPYIFFNLLEYSPEAFGYTFAIAAIGYVIGSLVNAKIIALFGIHTALLIGSLHIVLGALIMVLLCHFYTLSPIAIIVPQLLCEFGISIVIPISVTNALQPIPDQAGIGSAFIGFLRFLFAGISSVLVAQFQGAIQLAYIILAFALYSLINVAYVLHYQRKLQTSL